MKKIVKNGKILDQLFQKKKKQANILKSFTRKLTNSTCSQNFHYESDKKSFVKNSTIFTRKRIIAIYRNVIYKILLQMYSSFVYPLCFNSLRGSKKKLNIKKNTVNRLLTLKFKKHITKKRSPKQIKRALRFCVIKPMHLEVSYSMSTAILLYSPQRLSFPFYIDVDLILRSFR